MPWLRWFRSLSESFNNYIERRMGRGGILYVIGKGENEKMGKD